MSKLRLQFKHCCFIVFSQTGIEIIIYQCINIWIDCNLIISLICSVYWELLLWSLQKLVKIAFKYSCKKIKFSRKPVKMTQLRFSTICKRFFNDLRIKLQHFKLSLWKCIINLRTVKTQPQLYDNPIYNTQIYDALSQRRFKMLEFYSQPCILASAPVLMWPFPETYRILVICYLDFI